MPERIVTAVIALALAAGFAVALTAARAEDRLNDLQVRPPQLSASGAHSEGVDAPTVEIAVTMNGHTETFTKDLTYVSAHPNGEDCPPVCSVALVRLKSLGDPAAAA